MGGPASNLKTYGTTTPADAVETTDTVAKADESGDAKDSGTETI